MSPSPSALLSRPDPRPVLVSVLGGAWVVLSGFGILRAILAISGYAGGVELGTPDPMAELAAHSPELVDPAWFTEQVKKAQVAALESTLGFPLLLLGLLGIVGGVRLLLRRSWSRSVLVATGLGVITVSAIHAMRMLEIGMIGAEDMVLPPDVDGALRSVAYINIGMQSLPLLVGMSLLRHPAVAAYVKSSDALSASRPDRERPPAAGDH